MSRGKTTSDHRTRASKIPMAGPTAADEPAIRTAEQEDIGEQWLSDAADRPELRQRISQLVDARASRLGRMFDGMLDVIESGLKAKDHKNASIKYQDRDGQTRYFVKTYPDHYARLAATKRFQDLLTAGRPPARAETEEIEKTYSIADIGAAIALQQKQKRGT